MKRILVSAIIFMSFLQTFTQSVCIDSIWINGSLTWTMKFDNFVNTGIIIDSITSAEPLDSFDPDSIINVGTSTFWYYSKYKTCKAHSIRFDRISNLQLGEYLVNNSTSHEDLRKLFPTNCESTKPINIYGQVGVYQSCSIPVRDSKNQLWDMKIVFFFKNNKLVRVDFWEPM